MRLARVARRQHQRFGRVAAVVGLRQPAAVNALRPHQALIEVGFKAKVGRVVGQVGRHLLAAGVARVTARHRVARQARHAAAGVQVQPVIVLVPGAADPLPLLQQDERHAALLQTGGDGQPGRAGADDQGVRLYHCGCIFPHESSIEHKQENTTICFLIGIHPRATLPVAIDLASR